MMGIGAVIFDFNGVLVDDEAIHFALFREVLAQEGVVITERDYHERYLGYDDRGCFEAALADAGQSADRERLDQLIAQKARRYVEVAGQGLRFFPEAAETLGAVAARWPVAICSGALRPEIEYALRRLDRLDQITAIISAEDTDKGKPDPEGYRLALAALRARACNSHMIRPRRIRRRSLTLRRSTAWWSRIVWRGLFRPRGPGCKPSACPTPTPPISYAMLEPMRSSMDWQPSPLNGLNGDLVADRPAPTSKHIASPLRMQCDGSVRQSLQSSSGDHR